MLLRTSDISFMITIIGIVNGLALLSTVAGEERQKKYLHLFLAITKTTNVLLIPTALSVTFSCTQVKLTMVYKMVVTNQANRFSCIFLSPIFPAHISPPPPMRILGSNGAIIRATRAVILRHNHVL